MRSVLVELPDRQLPCVVQTTQGLTEGYFDGSSWWIPVRGPDFVFSDALEWEYMTVETEVPPDPLLVQRA